jgi:hypothetical protein
VLPIIQHGHHGSLLGFVDYLTRASVDWSDIFVAFWE